MLADAGVISPDEAGKSCVLFKKPTVDSGDLASDDGESQIDFPSKEAAKAASDAHLGIIASEDDPEGEYWYYTLFIFQAFLENRIMSDDDTEIFHFNSMPEAFEDTAAGEFLVFWHRMCTRQELLLLQPLRKG